MTNSPRRTSITDFAVEAAIPVLIIGLIWSTVVFAIRLKSVFYPGQEQTLNTVFFLYVMGTVMANRLAGLYGESEKAFLYSIALAIVMGLFALMFSARYGSLVGGTNAGEGFPVNLFIIAMVGFASYKICRESCFDIGPPPEQAKSDIQLRAKVRARQDWYRRELEDEERKKQPAVQKEEEQLPDDFPERPPGTYVIYFSLFSMALFAVGQRLLPQNDGIFYVRAFNCLLANLICALALLLLTTLSAVRFRCWQKHAPVPPGVGWFWVLTGSFGIVAILALAALPPRPVPEYLVKSAVREETAFPDEPEADAQKTRSAQTWGGTSKQIAMSLEKQERDAKKMREEAQKAGEGDGAAAAQEETGAAESAQTKEGGGSAPQTSGQGSGTPSKTGKGPSRPRAATFKSGPPLQAPAPSPPLQALETIGKILFIILLVVGVLVLLARLATLAVSSKLIERMRARMKSITDRLRGLFAPKQKVMTKRKLKEILHQTNLYMQNPFSDPALLKNMSKTDLVRYTYTAFERFACVQGYPPQPGQTALEFLKALPADFTVPEFQALLRLFMFAEYSNHTLPDHDIQKLRRIWEKMET